MEKRKTEKIEELVDKLSWAACRLESVSRSFLESIQGMNNDLFEIRQFIFGGGHNDK